MTDQTLQSSAAAVWALAKLQHGVVTRAQLLGLGFSHVAIKHRIRSGRLHPVQRGVYAVGRRDLPRHGIWMAAVLSCGPEAVASDGTAATLWRICAEPPGEVHVSIPTGEVRRRPGIVVHRRALAGRYVTRRHGIPVTTPVRTLVDMAAVLSRAQLETAINEADKRDLVTPDAVLSELPRLAGRPGVAALRDTLDRATFSLTDSQLERRFLPIARSAGLPRPRTGRRLHGFKVDFYWPELGLVVETDGLRYHRTPSQQARDRLRDQAHTAAGLTPLRFTHAQVAYEPDHVRATLSAVARRLGSGPDR